MVDSRGRWWCCASSGWPAGKIWVEGRPGLLYVYACIFIHETRLVQRANGFFRLLSLNFPLALLASFRLPCWLLLTFPWSTRARSPHPKPLDGLDGRGQAQHQPQREPCARLDCHDFRVWGFNHRRRQSDNGFLFLLSFPRAVPIPTLDPQLDQPFLSTFFIPCIIHHAKNARFKSGAKVPK